MLNIFPKLSAAGTALLLLCAPVFLASPAAAAQSGVDAGGVRITGIPQDWTHHQVVFSNPGTEVEAIQRGTHERWLKIVNDPRYIIQQLHRGLPAQGPHAAEVARIEAAAAQAKPVSGVALPIPDKKRRPLHKDWTEDLGTQGPPSENSYAAKWSFDTTGASCANDFAVFSTAQANNAGNNNPQVGRPTVVAYNNLYSGCGGTVPGAYWQYYTGGQSSNSPVLSLDGSQIAFIQSASAGPASLVVLKWAASPGLIILGNTVPASYRACTAPCRTTVPFGNSGMDPSNAPSSPYYDYANDVMYASDSTGNLHQFTGVFNGTPSESGSPWPVTIPTVPSGLALTSPVLDSATGYVFVGSRYNGVLYSVNTATGALVGTSSVLTNTSGTQYGLYDAPLVDSTAQEVYAFAGNDGTGYSGVYQFPTSFISGAVTETQVGPGYWPLLSGAFDNNYFMSSGASPTGNLYVCGQTSSSSQQTLNQISISAGVMGAQTASSYTIGNGGRCSPVTEFYNSNTGMDSIFLSTYGAYQGCVLNAGCLFGFDVTSGSVPTSPTGFIAAAQGAGGVIVDNASSFSGASQIYYTTLNPSGACGTSTGICAVQTSQAAP
jgi:hypothetical protein